MNQIGLSRSATSRLAFCNSVGFSAATAVPVWIGQFEAFGLTQWQALGIAFAQLLAAAAANLLTPIVLGRFSSLRVGIGAALAALAGHLLVLTAHPPFVTSGFILAGAALGALLAATNRIMAQSDDVHGNFALAFITESLFAGSVYVAGPVIVDVGGPGMLFALLAALATIAAMFLFSLRHTTLEPPARAAPSAAAVLRPRSRRPSPPPCSTSAPHPSRPWPAGRWCSWPGVLFYLADRSEPSAAALSA